MSKELYSSTCSLLLLGGFLRHLTSKIMPTKEVIVKSHYEEVIIIITRVQDGAEDECINNDNLRV